MFDDAEASSPQTGTPQESNCSDDVRREWYRKALIADIAQQSAKARFDQKKGEYRSILKTAEDSGVDIEAITNVLKKRFLDPDEVIRAERERLKMYELSGFIPGIVDNVLRRTDIEEPTSKESHDLMLLDAYDKGALAGRKGRILSEVNTYLAGTELHVRFIEGYREGQASISEEMAPATSEEAPPKAKRGRPKRVVTAEVAAPVEAPVNLEAADEMEVPF